MADGEITRCGVRIEPGDRLEAGDELEWRRPPWEEPPVPTQIPVLYEDHDLIVVDKPAGLPVVPAGGYLENTLVHLMGISHPVPEPPVPVHRLGRGTSGALLLARTARARASLCAQFRRGGGEEGAVRKIYRAITGDVVGLPNEIEILQPIGLVPHAGLGAVHAAALDGLPACSRCRILARSGSRVIWEIDLVTGRPHQIRIHLASIGAPLLGDPLYGPGGVPLPGSDALPGDIGYTLRACSLGFAHPATGAPMEVHAPIPPELMP
ncbi:MAG: Ribosomal large subunit pseudouridine synthase D [Planctomycetes bacterium ADurb.Bin412]|nr:MAG: Ribosomal large subunit pseudouridine synthase D [Planctomycetes bacterium ADurb.Bin412]